MNDDLVKQILHSPEAQRMRQMVTAGFYDRSRIGLWLFEIIGREYDEMAAWSQDIHLEAFPQTCTWSTAVWEWVCGIEPDDALSLDFRRERILLKKMQHPPINPARMELMLSTLTGIPVTVTENVAPYTFRVKLDESKAAAMNPVRMHKLLRSVKPSHLSVQLLFYSQTPTLPATLHITPTLPLTIATTTLPDIHPGTFDTALTPATGAANIGSTRLPTLPNLPRRAYIRDAATGAVVEAYIADNSNIHPAYIQTQ